MKRMFAWLRQHIWPWSEIDLLQFKLRAALDAWDKSSKHAEGLRTCLERAEFQASLRDSRHEQEWLKQAAVQAGVDFGYIDMLANTKQRVFNGELSCAKECYRRGMGYREFPGFLAMYDGRSEPFNPLISLNTYGRNNYGKR